MDIRTVEPLLGTLDKVGLSEPLLDIYSDMRGRYEKLDEIDPAIREFEFDSSDVKGEVLMPFMHAQSQTGHLYLVLAHAFQTRGYKPILASCHGLLSHCFLRTNHKDTEGMCVNCRHKSSAILDAYGFEPTTIEEYISQDLSPEIPESPSKLRSYQYRSVDVSRYALATTRRVLRKFSIDLEDDEDRQSYLENLWAAIYLAEFTHQIIDERDIIATVGNHPAYNYGGVVLAASHSRNIPAHSYGGGYLRKGSIIFGNMENRKGFGLFSDREQTTEFLQRELNDDQRQLVSKYMDGRRDGSTIRELNHYTRNANSSLSIDGQGPVIGMFTNLMWDGSLSDCAITFDSPLDWIHQTVERMADFPDTTMVLKPHPAEAHRDTKIKVGEWASENLEIPDNVHILQADTDVSPYELFPMLDVGLVYNSTVGLEMLYDGVPVILSGDTHYRDLGFTYEPETPAEYFELFRSIEELSLSESQQRSIERYAYYLLVKRHLQIEGLDAISNIHKLTHADIKSSDVLDHAIERLVAGDPAIVGPPRKTESP